MSYEIQMEIFDGPMDLLLSLIKEQEIDIYDIPIGYLTDQYLQYMRQADELNLEISMEFLLMAATLLEIKSKMLLPARKTDSEAENEEEEDPRTELVERLVEYRRYKEAAEQFRQLEAVSSKIFCKPSEDFSPFLEEQLHQNLTTEVLCRTFDGMIRQQLKKNRLKYSGEIYREHFTVEQAMSDILRYVSDSKKSVFTELVGEQFHLEKLITYFLAVLELIRQKLIIVRQSADFDEIYITRVDTVE